jgi:hypothetical protein
MAEKAFPCGGTDRTKFIKKELIQKWVKMSEGQLEDTGLLT